MRAFWLLAAGVPWLIAGCKPAKRVKIHPELERPVQAPPDLRIDRGKTVRIGDAENGVSYFLYAPAGPDSLALPVLVFADPDGDGEYPVNKYRALAEEYHWLLAGSADSRNGRTLDENSRSVLGILADLAGRWHIHPGRVYLAGFSGGSRVVSYAARMHGRVTGVIGIGAGMTEPQNTTAAGFFYVGITGLDDFNYGEMLRQYAVFKRTNLRNNLIVYEGRHEWPPSAVFGRALAGLQLDAMRNRLIPRDPEFIESCRQQADDDNRLLTAHRNFPLLALSYEQSLNNLGALTDVSKIRTAYDKLVKSGEYTKALEHQSSLATKELNLQAGYARLLGEKDAGWWREEIRMLETKAAGEKGPERHMYVRILAYIRLVAYMYCDQAIKSGKLAEALQYVETYEIADPTNPEHAFMRATLYGRTGSNDKALEYLEKAAGMGYKNRKNWPGNPDFSGVDQAALQRLANPP